MVLSQHVTRKPRNITNGWFLSSPVVEMCAVVSLCATLAGAVSGRSDNSHATAHRVGGAPMRSEHENVSVSVSVTNTSDAYVVWDTRDSQCEKKSGPIDLPDTPPNAYVDGSGRVRLFSADTTTRVSYGPSIINLTRSCDIVFNSTKSPDPSLFETNEFIDATYAFDNGTVYALLHVEYPGMNERNCEPGVTYPYCWTVSMTLAVSHDWGTTWDHALPPPHHMVATPPYKYIPSNVTTNAGWGDSGGIVHSPVDGFYYAVVHNRFPSGLQHNGSCVMRTRDLTDPRSWRGWSGHDFSVSFVSPYESGTNPKDHVCVVLDLPECVILGVVYSTHLEQFVSSMCCGSENGGDGGSVFYYSVSADMIHWTTPEVLYTPDFHTGDSFFNYPKLMDVSAPARGDRNFETIGQTAQLYYVSVTRNFYTLGRQLYAVNVTFNKSDGVKTV